VEGPYYVYVITDAAHAEGSLAPTRESEPVAAREASAGDNADARDRLYRTSVYEGTRHDNNIGMASLQVVYREPDLQVDQIEIDQPHPQSGQTVTVSWTVSNRGNRATRLADWYDGVFLSKDASLDDSDYALVDRGTDLEKFLHIRATHLTDDFDLPRYLKPGESYTNRATFVLPSAIEGDFHLIVKADTDIARDIDPLRIKPA
ncbi:CARDB domain-containing protein, partial [Parachitinimonas caeni]